MKAHFHFAILLSSIAGFTAMMQGANYYWTGAEDTQFHNPNNWLVNNAIPATPPANAYQDATSDMVIFEGEPTANQPVLSTNYDLRGITFNSSGWTISSTDPATILLRVTNTGRMNLNAEGTNIIDTRFAFAGRDSAQTLLESPAHATIRFTQGFSNAYPFGGGGTILLNGNAIIESMTGSFCTRMICADNITLRLFGNNDTGGKGVGLDMRNQSTLECYANSYNFNLSMDSGTSLKNMTETPATFVNVATGANAILGKISGAFNLTLTTADGGARTVTFGNADTDFTGIVRVADNLTVQVMSVSPMGGPGAFGSSPISRVTLGDSNGNGGGSATRQTAVLSGAACEIGQDFLIGSANGFHKLGANSTQVGTSVFSGNIALGLGSSYNGDNPNLYITAGINANVNFTGNITNWVTRPSGGSWAVRSGKVFMQGPGMARLSGVNTYRGGTFINSGTLFAASDTALGTGNATLDGGTLLLSGITLTNPVVIGENGGGIGGRGILPVTLAITNNITLCPGDFTGALSVPAQTWGSGGAYQWQISTNGFDQLFCDTTLTCEATPEAPFTITVASINDLGQPAPLDGFDPGGMYRWQIAGANALATFNPDAFVLDTTGFAAHNTLHPNAAFELKFTHTGVYLVYGLSPRTLFMLR